MFFYLLVLFSQVSSDSVKVVISDGMGSIVAGDVAKAKDDAVADALRTAVETTVGMLISSETLVKNFQTVDDRIYSHSTGYVASYNIISESHDQYTYKVKVKAVVKLGKIKDDLAAIGLLLSRKQKPRIMVLIQEKNMGNEMFGFDMNVAETEVMEKFMAKGFTFVDKKVIADKVSREKMLAATSGDIDMAKAIGAVGRAEVIIVGKAVSHVASGVSNLLGNMKSCQADVTLKAVNVDNGEIIAVVSKHAATVHIDPMAGGDAAIKKATDQAADELMTKILERWSSEVTNAQRIELTVYGFKNFNEMYVFKQQLPAYIRGIKDIASHGFQHGAASMEVSYEGNAQSLAEELVAKQLPSFNVIVKSQTPNEIVLKVKKKE